jgi:Histidine kinase-, DNA gyrase B-, and HSP90-like ATPase
MVVGDLAVADHHVVREDAAHRLGEAAADALFGHLERFPGLGVAGPHFRQRLLDEVEGRAARIGLEVRPRAVALDGVRPLGDLPFEGDRAPALANGYRHSGASRQRVSVGRNGAALTITVSDDGRGFDLEQVLAREADVGVEGGHFGLRGIQDRVTMLGGTFALESTPGQGTSLTVTLPAE